MRSCGHVGHLTYQHLFPALYWGPVTRVVPLVCSTCPRWPTNQIFTQRHCVFTPLHDSTALWQGDHLHKRQGSFTATVLTPLGVSVSSLFVKPPSSLILNQFFRQLYQGRTLTIPNTRTCTHARTQACTHTHARTKALLISPVFPALSIRWNSAGNLNVYIIIWTVNRKLVLRWSLHFAEWESSYFGRHSYLVSSNLELPFSCVSVLQE